MSLQTINTGGLTNADVRRNTKGHVLQCRPVNYMGIAFVVVFCAPLASELNSDGHDRCVARDLFDKARKKQPP